MKWIGYIILSLLACSHVYADSDFALGFSHISNESFLSRFYLTGELFVTDETGKKLLAPTTDGRVWRPGIQGKKISGDWITTAKGIRDVALQFDMDILPDNSLKVSIKQYDEAKGKAGQTRKFGNLIREEMIDVENFAPIVWVAEKGKDFRVVLIFTPKLEERREGQTIDKITIGGDRGTFTVTDNQGYLWGDHVRFGGVISGISAHRGAFVFSYYPFKGGKEMGYAMGKDIVLNLSDKLKVTVNSEDNVLPDQMRVKVYGFYNPKFKMDRPNSVWSFGQEKVEQISKEFGL